MGKNSLQSENGYEVTEEEIEFILENNTPRELAVSIINIQKVFSGGII
jgi:hypothetical protein